MNGVVVGLRSVGGSEGPGKAPPSIFLALVSLEICRCHPREPVLRASVPGASLKSSGPAKCPCSHLQPERIGGLCGGVVSWGCWRPQVWDVSPSSTHCNRCLFSLYFPVSPFSLAASEVAQSSCSACPGARRVLHAPLRGLREKGEREELPRMDRDRVRSWELFSGRKLGR